MASRQQTVGKESAFGQDPLTTPERQSSHHALAEIGRRCAGNQGFSEAPN
jgi:hypothetical protein